MDHVQITELLWRLKMKNILQFTLFVVNHMNCKTFSNFCSNFLNFTFSNIHMIQPIVMMAILRMFVGKIWIFFLKLHDSPGIF